jgi:hypothetical protein
MKSQAAFVYSDATPDSLKNIAVCDNLAGALHQNNQKVEPTAAETYRLAVLLKPAFRGEQAEGAKCKR